ncbi:conserved hypothetical protein [Stutzerimonas stutzeri A1501]|uniref:Uncharacterized protein n=1 Tax=Stutzerimonas stutzeri (strain A1501) TaxID=379731 RepID=A4VR79_STUS1|nr:conserved hypothetical protein [Stutzerimonas stutzeri A1501]
MSGFSLQSPASAGFFFSAKSAVCQAAGTPGEGQH